MAEGLQTPDGRAVDADAVEQEFARAMAAPPAEAELPKRPADDPKAAPKRRGRPPKGERARTESKAATVALSDAERVQGVQGVVQLAAGVCAMAGRAKDSTALQADGLTLANSAETLAEACAATAKADARFAAVIDRVCAAGPYSALIGAVVGVGMQIARNHKPELALPGTVSPEEILQSAMPAEPMAA